MRVFSADIANDTSVDVSVRVDVDAFARSVYEQTANVDYVFNNAGVMPVAPLVETSEADWARVIGINLLGVMHVVCAFVPLLRAQPRQGYIVNTASMAGFAPPFGAGCGAYAATKSAVVSISESLAHELQPHGIAVSVVCPSGVATQIFGSSPAMRPFAGLMEPEHAARLILDGVLAGRFYIFTHTDDTAHARLLDRWAAVERDFVAATEKRTQC